MYKIFKGIALASKCRALFHNHSKLTRLERNPKTDIKFFEYLKIFNSRRAQVGRYFPFRDFSDSEQEHPGNARDY